MNVLKFSLSIYKMSSIVSKKEGTLSVHTISLIKMLNSNGPKTDPCGTPTLTGSIVDTASFIATNYFVLVKYELIRKLQTPQNPQYSNQVLTTVHNYTHSQTVLAQLGTNPPALRSGKLKVQETSM